MAVKTNVERQRDYRERIRNNEDIKTLRINISAQAKERLEGYKKRMKYDGDKRSFSKIIEDLILKNIEAEKGSLEYIKENARWKL
jgi:hypothetical protein